MNNELLLIFTRNPELGKAKTRLAKTVGDETALEIYKFLLDKTRQIAKECTADKAVYYSVKVRENDMWDPAIFQKHQQEGNDLGNKMKNAFQQGFNAGYEKVVIIGSDLYDLTSATVAKAFEALSENDVVIGPAEDGGYYLLGMKILHTKIFENKDWGTDTVRAATLADIKDKKIHLLPMLNDVDVYEDIQNHPAFQHFLN